MRIETAKTVDEVLAKYGDAEKITPAFDRVKEFSWNDMLKLRSEILELRAERERWAADARLAAYVRERAEPAADGWRIDVWINGAPLMETLDDACKHFGNMKKQAV